MTATKPKSINLAIKIPKHNTQPSFSLEIMWRAERDAGGSMRL